jgi:hypothetical protein
MQAERWGPVDPELRTLVEVAIDFGNLSTYLRAAFDRAYRAVLDGGLQAPFGRVASEAFPEEEREDFVRVVRTWQANGEAQRRLASLATHGSGFVSTLRSLAPDDPRSALANLIELHLRVQRDRRHHGGWLRHDGDLVLLEMAGYSRWLLDPERWVVGYKQGAILQLLQDLGQLP